MADPASSPDDLPESLRLHAFANLAGRLEADHRALLDFLGGGLAKALPDAVRVRRHGILRGGKVAAVEVLLPGRQYDLRVTAGRLEATVGQVVGGVVLRHDRVAVDAWVESLLADLERMARESESARAALQRLVF